MIANCDQYIDFSIDRYLQKIEDNDDLHGLIMTMKASENKWSYIKYNKENLIELVAEKKVISDEATVGIYNFKHGYEFVSAAESMIRQNIRVNNEFYVAPAFNELIKKDKRITYLNIGSVGSGMYGLGTPEDLFYFHCNTPQSALKIIKIFEENS